ncbi:MAG: PQQ-dependent sugar dehydrogenase, partial [Burkholderiaceae bacterium]
MKKTVLSLSLSALTAAALLAAGSASAVTVKADNFQQAESPWDMAFLPDGTMFFTEKCKGLSVRMPSGDVKRLLGVGGSSGFAKTKGDLFCDGQAGVLGVAVDPEFSSNR